MAYLRQPPSSANETTIQEIFNLLKEGETEIKSSANKDVLLFLGVTGSGKTTASLFIAGYDDYIIATKNNDTDGYTITDTLGKIGNSSIDSQTIFPDLLLDSDTEGAFYDCPGFKDRRGPLYEIAASYFIKKIINYAERVKLIFTVSYAAVDNAFMDKEAFPELLTSAAKMMKNIPKYNQSIGLLVTKVKNEYKIEEVDGVLIATLIPDEKMISNIGNYIASKFKNDLINSPTAEMKAEKIQFINAILAKNNGNYTNIGLVRQPNKPGKYSEIKLLQDSKPYLLKVIHKNIAFTTHNKNDFSHAISDKSELHLHVLIEKINKDIVSNVAKICKEIEKYYDNKIEPFNGFQDLHEKFRKGYDLFLATKTAAITLVEPRQLVEQITKNIINLNITLSNVNFRSIINDGEYLKFIKTINNELTVVKPREWVEGLSNLVTYLDDSQRWYNFLKNFYDILSKYHVQQHYQQHTEIVDKLKHQIKLNEKNPSVVSEELKHFLDKISKADSEKEYDKIKNIRQLSAVKLKILNDLLDLTLQYKIHMSCDDNNLIIKGQYVRLNEIHSVNCERPKSIKVFALNKIFIDTNLNKTGDQVQLSIIAPKLEIIGSPSIILDGSPGESWIPKKAANAIANGATGENGKPGKPGGPTGHFLSISQNVANGEYLKLSIVGGKGGPGQKGGDGKQGAGGTIPPVPKDFDDPPWNSADFQIVKEEIKWNYYPGPSDDIIVIDALWWVQGKNCTDGGNGGNGGVGGKGGNSLDPVVVNLIGDSKFEITNANGQTGTGGYAGEGAKGGYPIGKFLKIKGISIYPPYERLYRYKVVSLKDLRFCYLGDHGYQGSNSANIKEPKKIVLRSLPSAVINDYKNYVRDNLSGNVMESFLIKFLDDLEHHKSVKKLYDVFGFVSELQGLEKQFYVLRKQIPFLPFYQSLLHRIEEYADKLHADEELTDDNKKVLGFLHTSVLSRIYSINNSAGNSLILDLNDFLKERIKEIEKLKELESVASVNDEREKYQKSILEKINEAQNFVEEQITPELNNVMNGVDHQIELLVEQTIALQNQTQTAKDKLAKKRKELANAAGLKVVFGILKTANQFLSFLGPVGGAAGAVMSGGVMVAESLLIEDSSGPGSSVDLPAAVENALSKIREPLKDQQSLFKVQLDDVQTKLKDFSEKKPSANVSDIQKKISEIKQQLEKEIDITNSIDEKAMDKLHNMRKDVQGFLRKKRKMLENQKTRNDGESSSEGGSSSEGESSGEGESSSEGENSKNKDEIDFVKGIQNIFAIIKVPLEYYNKIKSDQAKIDELSRAMAKLDEKLQQLRLYEEVIYRIIAPTCKNLRDKMNQMGSHLQGQSHAALDISKWRIQGTLRDVKLQMKQMTQGFRVQENLARCIEKLEEGVNVMVKIYDRIEDYHDKAELADYIANIYSNKAGQIKIQNEVLRREVDSLKWIIQSNLVLEKYEISMNAFKQHIFPFGDYFFAEFELPSHLVSNDTNSLVVASGDKISLLRSKLKESTITMNEYDQYRHSRVSFNSKSIISKPFFVWSHDEHKNAIKRLLEGEKITLKSDIVRGLKQNAIKFNVVNINLKLENETMQLELNEQLQYFKVVMMHLGTSYYRCHNKFYTIVSDNQTLTYTFKKNQNGVPDDSSDSYQKLEKYEPFLSPYTLWSIQLMKMNLKQNNTFASLAKYKNEKIDLELEGVGQYVDSDFRAVCNDNLNKYYAVDETTSEIDDINLQNKRSSIEIPTDILFNAQHNSNHIERKRRNLDEQELLEAMNEDSFSTSGACSNMKSSFMNDIINLVGTGLMAYGYLNPMNKISHWFTNEEKIVEKEDFMALDSSASVTTKWTNIPPSLNSELPTLTNMFINDDSSAVDSSPNYFSICNDGNLLLLDLIIRQKNGIKYKQSHFAVDKQRDSEYSHSLAYNAHFSKI